MASLGVLANLIQGMSASQLDMPRWNPVEEESQRELLQQRRTGNETALLTLFEQKQKQAAEQEFLNAVKNDPRVAQMLLGGSVLGSLGGAGGQPAPTSLTQQTLMPGQPPGAPQTVPGGQDLSRFAGVSPQGGGPIPPDVMVQTMPTVTPPQSTIASLGPAGQSQGPPQPPQNPVLEMAQRDPRAAMMLQQQMQAQQDRQWKLQEQQLSNGVKVAEYVSRMLQGVNDQNSLDQAREQIRLVHPQAASQVPQMYSKEGIASVQQRGASITEMAQNRYHEAKARNLDMETQMFPELAKRFGMDGGTQAPAGDSAATTTAPGTVQPAGRAGQPPQESEHTRLIRAEAVRQGVDPDLAVAVATQESYLNPNAVGDGGKSLGYFQLQEGASKDVGIDPARRGDPALNIRGGVGYLKLKLAQSKGNVDEALRLYNGGGDPNYVANVRRFLPGGQGGGGTTGTAGAAPTDPRIAQLETKIAQRTRDAQIAALMKNESLSTRLNDDATRLTAEKNRLIDQSRHQQERTEETPRAVDRERQLAEQRQNLERQRQAGPLLPEDRRKLLTGLRTDIRAEPTFKVYQDVRNGYQNVRIGAESDSAQGDLAIINGMAKILDPSSAVMTGEARNVEEAQGQLQRWFNSPQRFFEGDRLTPDNRQRFLRMAHSLTKEKLTTAQTELKSVYEPLAKEGNIDFKQLLPMEDLKPLPIKAMTLEELEAERARIRGG